ncbi:hypothetical protein [Streptacidiphilus sp. EB129]|uniref:hypothetical protein n=1 Tax=Streptacidiphilus sp. EB129 TaxID=3156262 RepID=UPI003512FB0B
MPGTLITAENYDSTTFYALYRRQRWDGVQWRSLNSLCNGNGMLALARTAQRYWHERLSITEDGTAYYTSGGAVVRVQDRYLPEAAHGIAVHRRELITAPAWLADGHAEPISLAQMRDRAATDFQDTGGFTPDGGHGFVWLCGECQGS